MAFPAYVSALNGQAPDAFIVHHTGGRGTVEGVQQTLKDRGLGVQYVMDRDGTITQIGGPGSQHMLSGWGKGAGLNNGNTVGMEVIAKNDQDVTPEQVAAAKEFITKNYPGVAVYGHGEVNPGHKEADEGATIVNAIRNGAPSQSVQTAQAQPSPQPPQPDANGPMGANSMAQSGVPVLPLFGAPSASQDAQQPASQDNGAPSNEYLQALLASLQPQQLTPAPQYRPRVLYPFTRKV